jgi:hypothetical protein
MTRPKFTVRALFLTVAAPSRLERAVNRTGIIMMAGGYAKPPSGVSNAYVMGNNGDNGDGVSIREVDMPGEHTGGLLDKSNSTLSADPDDNSVIFVGDAEI